MGRIVIACYKPKPGKEAVLRELMKTHLDILKSQNLVTDRASIIMQAGNGTVLEVFEWRSQEAIDSAHSNPVIGKMWADYEAACDYIPVGEVPEANELFATFAPLE